MASPRLPGSRSTLTGPSETHTRAYRWLDYDAACAEHIPERTHEQVKIDGHRPPGIRGLRSSVSHCISSHMVCLLICSLARNPEPLSDLLVISVGDERTVELSIVALELDMLLYICVYVRIRRSHTEKLCCFCACQYPVLLRFLLKLSQNCYDSPRSLMMLFGFHREPITQ